MEEERRVLDLDAVKTVQPAIKIGEKEYLLKSLSYKEYKEVGAKFKSVETDPSFENVEGLVTFLIPELSVDVIENLTMPQLKSLMEFVSVEFTR